MIIANEQKEYTPLIIPLVLVQHERSNGIPMEGGIRANKEINEIFNASHTPLLMHGMLRLSPHAGGLNKGNKAIDKHYGG